MIRLKGFFIACIVCLSCAVSPAMADSKSSAAGVAAEAVSSTTVNINKAGADELAAMLSGVGVKRAKAIVAYREVNGPFSDAGQLQEIKGIGMAIVDKNRDKIRL